MNKNRFISLQLGMATAFAVTVIVTSAFIGTSTFLAARSFIRDGIRERLQNLATLAAGRLDVAAIASLQNPEDEKTPEYTKLKSYLQEVKQASSDIRFVYVYRIDPSGKIFFVADNEPEDSKDISHLGDEYKEASELLSTIYHPGHKAESEKEFTKDQWGIWLSCYVPVVDASGKVECALGMDMSAKAVADYERRFLYTLIGLGVFTGGIALIGSLWFSRRISQPLLRVAEDLGRVQRLELEPVENIPSHVREVVLMQEAAGKMKNSLRAFRKYVPADLVTDLMVLGKEARLSVEKLEITVFFSDIANFTTISEKTPPEQLVENLAIYFDKMTRSIIDMKGTVDKYIGDAIMAFWGAPRPNADHAVQACLTAIKCRDHSRALGEQQRKEGKLPMLTRIGLNTGVAIVGNIGYDARLNYTAMGDAVNLGSRLEGLNKFYGTQILISESTREQARQAVETRFIDVVAVKGKSIPVRIYEVICEQGALSGAQASLVIEYERGMELYLGRKFSEAVAAFEKLVAAHPDDLASALMLERSRKFLDNPPHSDWHGEFVMTSK